MKCETCKMKRVCDELERMGKVPKHENCRCYSPEKLTTNADRIRAMTVEELAKFMALNTDCYYCRAKDNDRCASLATTPCGDIWLDWLKQEATDG